MLATATAAAECSHVLVAFLPFFLFLVLFLSLFFGLSLGFNDVSVPVTLCRYSDFDFSRKAALIPSGVVSSGWAAVSTTGTGTATTTTTTTTSTVCLLLFL